METLKQPVDLRTPLDTLDSVHRPCLAGQRSLLFLALLPASPPPINAIHTTSHTDLMAPFHLTGSTRPALLRDTSYGMVPAHFDFPLQEGCLGKKVLLGLERYSNVKPKRVIYCSHSVYHDLLCANFR